MSIGATAYLSNLCFADDVVLIASTSNQLKKLMEDLRRAALARGLKVHSGKTKVLTNARELRCKRVPDYIIIENEKYEVLAADASTKYLGRKVCYIDPHGTEFCHRISTAWGTFSKHKDELIDKRIPLKTRLKLFDATVSASLLYGCETWVLKADQERRLKATQRKMVRMILHAKRRKQMTAESFVEPGSEETQNISEDVMEPWPEFFKRTAEQVQEQCQRAGILEWTVKWRRRKWTWIQRLFTTAKHKWSSVATIWQPEVHSASSTRRKQEQAFPKKRWEDDIKEFIKKQFPDETGAVRELAEDRMWWRARALFWKVAE